MPANLDLVLLAPAFVAGLLVVATHVPLGRRVLARGVVFLDLAVAQVASFGVIGADALGWEIGDWHAQVAAVTAALLAAALLVWTDRRWPQIQEALIGVLFVAAASAQFLVLADNPHGGEHVKDLLAGQILWVTWDGLLPLTVVSAAILSIWMCRRAHLGDLGFYTLFALCVTQSVQVVGVYLVFATLILPALAGLCVPSNWSPRGTLAIAYGVGALGYGIGLGISAIGDLPSGPSIVCALVSIFLAMALIRRFA